MNHEYLNGTHPALLVALRFNSDVQLPYRMPIIQQTHSDLCDSETCLEEVDPSEIIDIVQNNQNAQAGYACDYCAKNQALAFNEVCQCCKGYETLTKKLSGESKNHLAGRLRKRLLSDALGKGIVRGQVENTNLRVHGKDHDVTAAECFRTCATHAFSDVSM